MKQVLVGGIYNELHNTDTEYNSISTGYLFWHTLESTMRQLIPTGGKLKSLRVSLDGAPGAGNSYIFTLMVNGVSTALTCTIAGTDTSGSDITHEVDVVAWDKVSLECAPISIPTVRNARWSLVFEGSNAGESITLGGGFGWRNSTRYLAVSSCGRDINTDISNEDDTRQICPTSGKFKKLYAEGLIVLTQGTCVFTLRKNGVNTALAISYGAGSYKGSNTVDEVAVAAGDVLTMKLEAINTGTKDPSTLVGMVFVPDIDGESLILGGSNNDLSASATEYNNLAPGNPIFTIVYWTATESQRYQLAQECVFKKLYMLLSAAPGDGKSYTFTVRIGGANGNLTVAIADTNTTSNDTEHTDAISDDDLVDLKSVPSGTPTVADAYWGLVGFIAPPYTPENKSANMGSKMVAAGLI